MEVNKNIVWDSWLSESDSASALAPDDYDNEASDARAAELNNRLRGALAPYKIKCLGPDVFQDGTGLTQCWVLPRTADPRTVDGALASVMLSHFGDLATIRDCKDPELFERIRGVLEELRLKFIDVDYLIERIYQGKCASLHGITWDERYFSIAPQYPGEES